ncbi:MAG: DnaJ domain-containing protein [Halioglobus sp.]|nr:DnaJ domain-containing protein [Halioglobus sp.]
MPRIILLIAIIAVAYMLLRRAKAMPPHKRRTEYIKLGMGIALIATIFLAATGRMNWIGAAFAGLLVAARQGLPLLLRLFPMLASLRNKSTPAAGQNSTVETSLLRMEMDHDSSALQGEILQGTFSGWLLKDMDRQQLEEFFTYCSTEDTDSLQLLDSYLKQRFPGEAFSEEQQQSTAAKSSVMGRSEALAVLGLKEDATKEDIITAHRKLIQKLHPDRGGNDYLAAQINQAKDQLLG